MELCAPFVAAHSRLTDSRNAPESCKGMVNFDRIKKQHPPDSAKRNDSGFNPAVNGAGANS